MALVLIVSHLFAYARGARRAHNDFYYRYFRPMTSRQQTLVQDLLKLALLDDKTSAQENAVLYLQKRLLQYKAMKYAVKCRRYRHALRRNERLKTWALIERTMQTIARLDTK